MTNEVTSIAPAAVIDTNTVLDWLVFGEAGVGAVARAVQDGRLRWLVCRRMRDELERTLGYPSLAKWKPDSERVLSLFDRWAAMQASPAPAALNMRCSDADDQVFIDLALAHGARWLFSHDRALLKLARRARPLGLEITQARHWPAGG